jgi:catecholate siderophore receptor
MYAERNLITAWDGAARRRGCSEGRAGRSLLTLALLGLACLAQAQAPPAAPSIRGKVLDPEGAVVAGAQILVSGPGGFVRTAVSDMAGEFGLALEPAEYSITIRAAGFQESTHPLIIEGAAVIREYVLSLASRRDSIEVRGEAMDDVVPVASATKTPVALRDVPQSIAVVPKELIRDQALTGIAEVVQYVPGITAGQGEGNRDQIVIRGNSSTADFYLNGVRDDVQYYRDLYDLERVEALKGPNALMFGRGGGGGVINRVTKEAGFTPLHEFTLQTGSYSNRRFAADFGHPLNDAAAFRFNGVYENSDSHRRFVGLERFGINPTLTLTAGPWTKLKLGYEYFRDHRVADRGIPSFRGAPIETSHATFFGKPEESKVRAGVHLGILTVEHRAGKLDLRNNTLAGDYDKFYQNFVPGAVEAAGSHTALTAYNNATARRNIFNQTDLSYYATTGSVRHVLLAGFELGRQLTDNFRNTGYFNDATTSILVPLHDPIIDTPVTFRQSASDADNHLTTWIAATYIQDQIELNQHVQLIAGVRFERFDLKLHNNRNGQSFRRIDNMVSPRAGVVAKPVLPLSLYFSYSVSHLPSAGDQFASLNAVTETLKPERFNNYEGGAKWDVHSSLSLTMAAYRLDRLNTRATDPNDPTRVVQTGSQRTNGFEIGVDGRVTSNWRVSGGYAYQDAFVTSATTAAPAGAQVSLVPRHSVSLWNSYRFHPRWEAGLGILNRSDMFAAIDNKVTLPGYTRADAAVFFTLTEGTRLQVNLENLLGADYFLTAHNNNNIQPGSPRAARVGLTTRL